MFHRPIIHVYQGFTCICFIHGHANTFQNSSVLIRVRNEAKCKRVTHSVFLLEYTPTAGVFPDSMYRHQYIELFARGNYITQYIMFIIIFTYYRDGSV